jgi:hypothetical protein
MATNNHHITNYAVTAASTASKSSGIYSSGGPGLNQASIGNSTWTVNPYAQGTMAPITTSAYGNAQFIMPCVVSSTEDAPFLIRDNYGVELVRVGKDGNVVWAINVIDDEASRLLVSAIEKTPEMLANINYIIKQKIRDTVFKEISEMAEIKGSLTTEDLLIIQQAAKITDKLRGIK